MAASVLVAVRSALATKLAALAGLADYEVGYQWRVQSESRSRVWTRNGRVTLSSASMKSGRNFRNEEGSFEVAVLIETPASDMATVAAEAITAGQAIEQYIADNKLGTALSVTGLNWIAVEGQGELKEGYKDGAYIAEWSIPVRYSARIT